MFSTKVTIPCRNGKRFTLALPKPAKLNSFYAFSMHKAGSSLLEKMLSELCYKLSIPVVNPHSSAWRSGISTDQISANLDLALLPTGYAYIGFRHLFPLGIKTDLSAPKKILLVRDPRDMLTSLYFSHKYSHSSPSNKGDAKKLMSDSRENARTNNINDFAIDYAHHYKSLFSGYKEHLLSLPNTKVYRYEDVIFDKETWLLSMLDFYGLFNYYSKQKIRKQVNVISSSNDIRPIGENPGSHIRQVAPGNHKKHLSPDTIRILNSELNDFLIHFGYS